MKVIIQLFLFFLLLLISFTFYKYYFYNNKPIDKSETSIKTDPLLDNKNNLIKNLKYDVKFENNTQYSITAELSELSYENEIEIVKMQIVSAKFIDKDNTSLIIQSEKANYNNSSYNTQFSNNVVIQYMNNFITADNLDLDFDENIVTIYNNVIYEDHRGKIKSDNVVINLITKNAEIFMNNSKNKVEVLSK